MTAVDSPISKIYSPVGSADDDSLVLSNGDGAIEIRGFRPGAATDDRIDFSVHCAVASLADVQGAAAFNGTDTVIDMGGGGSITLVGVDVSDSQQDGFVV